MCKNKFCTKLKSLKLKCQENRSNYKKTKREGSKFDPSRFK